MDALNNISKELNREARARRKDMKKEKEIKAMAAKKRLPKMETWDRQMFTKGAPCEKGETAEKTGCSPKSKEGAGGAPSAAPPKKPAITKAGTEEADKVDAKKGDRGEDWGSLGKDDPSVKKRREEKKKEKAEKKAKKEKESPKLDTMKDVDEYLKKGEKKEEKKEEKKMEGKRIGSIFIPKGGGRKRLRWTGKIWTDGDAIHGGTRTSGPMHGRTGQRIDTRGR